MFCPSSLWRKDSRLFWWEERRNEQNTDLPQIWEIFRRFISKKITLPRSSPGKGELSVAPSYAALQTLELSVLLQRCRQLGRDIRKKAEKFWKLPGGQQSEGAHSTLNCLCGDFQYWQTGKCWWGTFSSECSDHLRYSTCDWFSLWPLQILCQATYFCWVSSSTEERVTRTSDRQKAAIVEWTEHWYQLWLGSETSSNLWWVNSGDIFQGGYLMLASWSQIW